MSKSSYAASTISVALLLLLLGAIGYLMLEANKAARELASGLKITAFLEDEITDRQRAEIEKRMSANENITSFTYANSAEATIDFEKHTGLKIDTTYGANPIPSSYGITPKSVDAAAEILRQAPEWDGVLQVHYPSEIGAELTRKVKFMTQIGLYGGIILLLVALLLMYYTLKLSILNSAESIRTMQLVGARKSFIKKPYIKHSVIQGFVAALIATGLLILLIELFTGQMDIPHERTEAYWKQIAMIGSVLCIIGVILCTIFTTIVLGIIVKNRRI